MKISSLNVGSREREKEWQKVLPFPFNRPMLCLLSGGVVADHKNGHIIPVIDHVHVLHGE